MTTCHRFGNIAIALVLAFAVFAPRKAHASPDLFPPDDKLIKMDCASGKCKTIPRDKLPPFIADLISAEGLPFTPEVLGLFYLRAMRVACDRADGQRIILHPRLHGFSTKADLEALAARMGCVRLAYAFNGQVDMVIPTEVPPCQRGRAECDKHVAGLETRLAADEQFVTGLQAAVAQGSRRYSALRNAIADCEDGRVTLDEQGNPVCNRLPKAAGIVWPWQLLALVLGVLAVALYLRQRVITRRFEEVFAAGVNKSEAEANRLKDKVIAGVQEELRVEREAHETTKQAAQRLDALLAVVGTLTGVRPGKHDTNETALRLKVVADALGVTFDAEGNPSEDLTAAAQRVVVAQHTLQEECDGVKQDRLTALRVLGYDETMMVTEAVVDLTKKVHDAAGTPKDKREKITLWAAVAGIEFNARALARRVRTLMGRLGRVGMLLEVIFDKEADGADEILPALGKLREKLGIRGVGMGYSKTIPAAVTELVIAREAAEGAVESLRAARQPVLSEPTSTPVAPVAESAPAVQPSAPAAESAHGNGARQRAVEDAFHEIQTCASHAGQPNRQRRILAALERLRREVPALIAV